eukprot:GFUD01023055.1.p1 GENE.GFUD01023055.1~~GFUD01023055.1.p1  ORF type:complete len:295 (-),score=96.88 GFUD01023055.1:88-930(-)
MAWVKLNVGGQIFETQLSTLTAYPTSTLAKIFQSDMMHNDPVRHDGVYHLDCDPQCFQPILSWLRYGTISIPTSVDIRLVMMAAKHLGLDEMAKQLDKECSGRGAMTDWLKLNVGGTMFETSRATLTSHPTSSLARMFEPNSNLPPATTTPDGVFQIDACPQSFSVILNWLRYRHLMLGEARAEDVLPVADYFGLGDLQDLLTRHKQKEAEASSKFLSCIEDSVDRLEDVFQQLQCELNGVQEKMEDIKIEVAGIATGLEDLWRIKCEVSNIASIMKEQN